MGRLFSIRVPTFRDHFSSHAENYARWRPGYPPELYEWLASLVEHHDLAWDCATGNGQAARGLAGHFGRVVATDASLDQLAHREASAPSIAFHAAEATHSALAPGSVDLVSVAQAIHWFDLEPFEAEVRRVLRPGGVLAAWTYQRFRIEPAIDEVVTAFAEGTVGPFWPPQRRHVDARYATLGLSLDPIEAPEISMLASWTFEQLMAYVRTWSAVRRWWEEHGRDPVVDLERELEPLWAPREGVKEIRWRMGFLEGRNY